MWCLRNFQFLSIKDKFDIYDWFTVTIIYNFLQGLFLLFMFSVFDQLFSLKLLFLLGIWIIKKNSFFVVGVLKAVENVNSIIGPALIAKVIS